MLRIVDPQLRANTYVVPTVEPARVIVIDPGLDTEAIQQVLDEHALRPVAIACTHGHFDHVASAYDLQERYSAPVYMHAADQRVLRSANFLLMACRIDRRIILPTVQEVTGDESAINVNGSVLRFIHAPGHTPGSCLIEFGDSVFTGDTVYRNAVGESDFPGEDPALLRQSIRRVWGELNDASWIRPGHGGSAIWSEVKLGNAPLRRFLGLETTEV
jgi:glyoxylase-like metal-dependent hydrolase (beta-lactamase superfamily II)